MNFTILISFSLLMHSLLFTQEPKNTDFDFYYGTWEVQNKRQMEDGSWVVFSAKVKAAATLNGQGNLDIFEARIYGKPYAGMSVRVFDSINNAWQIQWYDTDKITLDPQPSIGRFENGEGNFYKTIITSEGREAKVRFQWSNIIKDSFHWETSWSIDGETWSPTWFMEFRRETLYSKF